MTAPAANPARILIVDDDPIVAETLAEFLRAEGHKPETAADGSRALATLAKADQPPADNSPPHPFAVVISDVALPGMSGLDLHRRIIAVHSGIAVIILTAYGTIESAVQ